MKKSKLLDEVNNSRSGIKQATSRFLHIPIIESITDVFAETVTRPYGLFYGSLAMLISYILSIVISSYYGYDFNYLLGIAGFIIGFILGLIIEQLAKFTR